jgi:hypothetical protein
MIPTGQVSDSTILAGGFATALATDRLGAGNWRDDFRGLPRGTYSATALTLNWRSKPVSA